MALLGLLRMAPWRRGPLLLLRRPGVAVALLAAGAVASLPAAAVTPFLSSSRDATLHHQIAAACPWSAGVTASANLGVLDAGGYHSAVPGLSAADVVARRTVQASTAAKSIPLLGPATTTLVALVAGPSERPDDPSYPIYLVSRTDAVDHLQVLDGPRGSGVWVSDQYADFVGLKAGDSLTVNARGRAATLPIAGIYHSLRNQPDQPWWCDMLKVYRAPEGNRPPPEVVFVDQPTFLHLLPTLQVGASYQVGFPLTDPELNRDQARRLVVGITAFHDSLLGRDNSAFGTDQLSNGGLSSALPNYTDRADLVRRSMLPTVLPITAAGVLVGLVVLAAATAFWTRRRKQELVMLAAHGVGPGGLAVKAIVESLPALLAGAAAGWACAWLLVRWTGPDPVLSGEAAPGATLGVLGALAAAVLVTGAVAGVICRALTDQRRRAHRRILHLLPYELAVLVGAPLVWAWLGDQNQAGEASSGVGTAVYVPSRLLVVPIMVIAGLTVFAARLAILGLRGRARDWAPRTSAVFLAWRRIARHAVMVAVLAGATSVPIALAAYGATVTASVHTTIVDEARLHLGSDVVVTLTRQAPIPPSLAGQATEVLRADGALVGPILTDLLAVDPGSFARAAYWDSRLDDASLYDLLAPIRDQPNAARPAARSTPLTVVASTQTPAGIQRATWFGEEVLGGTVRVVSTTMLPAQRTGYPMALVPKDALGEDTKYAAVQLWVRGDAAKIKAAVAAARLPVQRIQVAADQYANTVWEPLTYTFNYLTALSLLTGLVTVVGLLLYLESQAPTRRRAYVLLRRMGLTARRHRQALLGELAPPLLAGLFGGLAITALLIAVVGSNFDVNPTLPPDTVVSVPYLLIALIAAAVVVVTFSAAGYAQARIGRANPAEVLRDAG